MLPKAPSLPEQDPRYEITKEERTWPSFFALSMCSDKRLEHVSACAFKPQQTLNLGWQHWWPLAKPSLQPEAVSHNTEAFCQCVPILCTSHSYPTASSGLMDYEKKKETNLIEQHDQVCGCTCMHWKAGGHSKNAGLPEETTSSVVSNKPTVIKQTSGK